MKHILDLTAISRKLRESQTPWEAKLWKYLRGRKLRNLKFKPQVPMGRYVVDFCCQDQKLIIELDVGQHSADAIHSYDVRKQNFLESHGYVVIRF